MNEHLMIVYSIIDRLKAEQAALERIILATPTSQRRNLLTEANIHLTETLNKIEAAMEKDAYSRTEE